MNFAHFTDVVDMVRTLLSLRSVSDSSSLNMDFDSSHCGQCGRCISSGRPLQQPAGCAASVVPGQRDCLRFLSFFLVSAVASAATKMINDMCYVFLCP